VGIEEQTTEVERLKQVLKGHKGSSFIKQQQPSTDYNMPSAGRATTQLRRCTV
jgi:hypothetical protein